MLIPVILAGIAIFFLASYILWRVRLGHLPESIPRVLTYHKVTNFEFGGTWMTPGRFANQIDGLLAGGFHFIGEDDFIATIEGSRKSLDREILLTFDDGYQELIETAIPVLVARKVPALIFIVTSYVGRENRWEFSPTGKNFKHMDWNEITYLSRAGFAIGSHTCNHMDLTVLGRDTLRRELVQSREDIEMNLDKKVKSVSYPFGRVNNEVKREVKNAGYRAAFTMYPRRSNRYIDKFALRREGVYIIDTLHTIKSKLGSGNLFWVEDLKGRAINGVAVLTPLFKGSHESKGHVPPGNQGSSDR